MTTASTPRDVAAELDFRERTGKTRRGVDGAVTKALIDDGLAYQLERDGMEIVRLTEQGRAALLQKAKAPTDAATGR